MSSNQAFIKAYGKDAAHEPAMAARTPPSSYEAGGTPGAPSPSRVLETWYSADSWYRSEAAPLAPVLPVPAPHVAFAPGYVPAVKSAAAVPVMKHRRATAGYEAPEANDLRGLTGQSQARNPRGAAEETDYRLSPPEPILPPEIVIEDEAEVAPRVKGHVAEMAAPIEYKMPPPVVASYNAVAVGSGLNEVYAPVQVVTGWEAAITTPAPVEVMQVAPVPAPESIVASEEPRSVEMPQAVAVKEVAKSRPLQETPVVQSAAPVAQMRLDAAVRGPVPKPHGVGATEAKKVEEPAAPAKAEGLGSPSHEGESLSHVTLAPAWEVDRFQWPEHCRELLKPENRHLADVGQRLANAAKEGLGILAITSTRRGEGRTTLALCMARAAADAGVKVALVDADSDNPQLVNELGVEAAAGWHDVVMGKQPLSEAAILSLEDKFTLFPWTTAGAIKSLNDPKVTRVLKQIAATHELVILDLGPTPGRETRLFEDGENCPIDAAVLVRDVRWTSAVEASRVASHLVSAGVESVGIAENFS
jgi:Mrp family chromosome partitioning ATPase